MSSEQLDQFKRQFHDVCNDWDKKLRGYPVFQKMEESTSIRPSHAVILAGIILVITLCFNLAPNALTNIIGFIHPAYYSLQALDTKTDKDDRQWLTYWIVFAFFNVVESITDVLLHWIPFYYFVKVVFIIWLSHPTYRGAAVVFNVLAPIMNNIKQLINPQPQPKTVGDVLKAVKKDIKNEFGTLKKDFQGMEIPSTFKNDPKYDMKFD